MSLASWPPTGYKAPTITDKTETLEEVFTALLKAHLKGTPTTSTARQRELQYWHNRWKEAKNKK